MKECAFDVCDKLIDFECGLLDEDETVELFSVLVETGLAWKLQGLYGRTATALIEAGLVLPLGTLEDATPCQ